MSRSRVTRSSATDTGHARDYTAIALAYAKRAAADKKQTAHCKWVRLAAQRHLDDLKRSKKKDFGYYFDPWHGNDVCDFAEKLPHVEGNWCKCPRAMVLRGEHSNRCGLIDLEDFQIFILVVVFGWRDKETWLRRFTVVYEELARKNAKSTLTAVVSLYCLACEDEPGPQILTAATTFDQAKKVFHPAKRMIEKTPALQEAFGLIPWAKSITCAENGGYMQPIHSKSKSQDGHNPHVVTLDELHAHSDRGLYDVMVSAFGARLQPLLWIITTAGFNTLGICYEQRTFGTKVLERSIIAEHMFVIIYNRERARLDAEALAIQHRIQSALLAEEIATGQVKDAKQAQALLAQQQAADRTRLDRQNMTPMERYQFDLKSSVSNINDAMENIQVDAMQGLTDGIAGAIAGTQKLGQVFKNVAQSIIADLVRIQLQKAIVGSIGNALGGAGSVFGIGARGGGAYLSSSSIAGAGSYDFSAIPGFATGTPSAPRGLALVGERGPELVKFSGGERVYNNADSKQMMGGKASGNTIIEMHGVITNDQFWQEVDANSRGNAALAVTNERKTGIRKAQRKLGRR